MRWFKIFDSIQTADKVVPVGRLQLVQIGGRRICLAHTLEGYFAVNDTCPHLGASLCQGNTNYLNQVICPWHSYRFDLKSGGECQLRTGNLVTYPIQIKDDGLFLGIQD